MTNFVPLKKQSKRSQKEFHAAQRGTWDGMSPVTRTAPGKKAWDRQKRKQADLRYEAEM